jgi:hypothetical protein
LSQIKQKILELILELSRVGCQLDSSGSVQSHSEGTTVPARAMLSVPDSEITTQKLFQNLNSAAARYCRLYCIEPSENFAVAVWTCGSHPTQTDEP